MIADVLIVAGLSGIGLGLGGIGSWIAAFLHEMWRPSL